MGEQRNRESKKLGKSEFTLSLVLKTPNCIGTKLQLFILLTTILKFSQISVISILSIFYLNDKIDLSNVNMITYCCENTVQPKVGV